jgi:predicted ATPase/DNA-binding winged helix-turn-helix (wHTH) protein
MSSPPRPSVARPDVKFGPFHLDMARRLLRRGEEAVAVGSRALEILSALLERPGVLVTKAELLERAWPGQSIDEANLRAQIAALRKALGDDGESIKSVSGLGYRFVGEINGQSLQNEDTTTRWLLPHKMPERPLGREAVITSICGDLKAQRLVTIVGAGGIGKTTVALATPEGNGDDCPDGICLIDLSSVHDAGQVPLAVATALRQTVVSGDPLEPVLQYLRNRKALLILDSCEHVIEAAANLAERILAAAPEVHILATSREALRLMGEVVHQLDPLASPEPTVTMTADEVVQFPAVQLFARMAAAGDRDFEIDDGNAALVAEICWRLDGIPLAIELAAALVGVIGLSQVRDGLDQRFAVLTLGRRTSLPRHRTLAATMDWSYNSLSPVEQAVLRRVATFAGRFTLSSGVAVASGSDFSEAEVSRAIVELANKSLISVRRDAEPADFRLLETTRAYAQQADHLPGERDTAAKRHAAHFLQILEETDWDRYDPAADRATIVGYIEEVRSALRRTQDLQDEPNLAVRLALAAERPWSELSLYAECDQEMRRALRYLDKQSDSSSHHRARVLVALVAANRYLYRLGVPSALHFEALEMATKIDDKRLQLRALFDLVHHYAASRQPDEMMIYAERFRAVAVEAQDNYCIKIAHIFIGYSYLERSELRLAQEQFEKFLAEDCKPTRNEEMLFGYRKTVSARVGQSATHLFQGQPETALALAEQALAEAGQHSATRYYALASGTCHVACFSGNVVPARKHVRALESLANNYPPWKTTVLAYRGMIAREEGDLALASRCLEEALAGNQPISTVGRHTVFLVELADVRRLLRQYDAANKAADLAFQYRAGDGDARIVSPVLRAKAEILAAQGEHDKSAALFTTAIESARSKGALVLELQAAVGLARLERKRGNPAEAKRLLEPIFARFTEGHSLRLLLEANVIIRS